MAETTNRKSEPGRRWTGGIGPWAFCLLTPALWFLPAGCAPDDFASNDPLFGSNTPPHPPTGPGAGAIQPVAGTVPALPQPASSGTPAALTGASRGSLDPARGDLRIGSDTGSPTWQPSGRAPAVALQPPQPAGGGPVPLQPRAVPEAQPTATPTGPGYEQLMAQLTQRGVSRLVIVPDGKDVLWSCVVPSKSEPGKQQHYEVRNPRDPVSALQALLEKIDKG